MLSGTRVSDCKSKDFIPSLTSWEYQGSHDKEIEEGNSHFLAGYHSKSLASALMRRSRMPLTVAEEGRPAPGFYSDLSLLPYDVRWVTISCTVLQVAPSSQDSWFRQ